MKRPSDLARMLRAMGTPLLLVGAACGPTQAPDVSSTSQGRTGTAVRAPNDDPAGLGRAPGWFERPGASPRGCFPFSDIPELQRGPQADYAIWCNPEAPDRVATSVSTDWPRCPPEYVSPDLERPAQFDSAGTALCRDHGWTKACCYQLVADRSIGRRYRPHTHLAGVLESTCEVSAPVSPPGSAAALGAEWTDEAALEHASVAAFSRLSLQLFARRAPAHLLARTHRAAIEETEHAHSAYAIASRLLGEEVAAGPLPVPESIPFDRETMLIETIVDGCVGELASTYVARALARTSTDPGIRRHHAKIAREEREHAELAFAILGWLADEAARESLAARGEVDACVHACIERFEEELAFLDPRAMPAELVRRRAGRPDPRLLVDSRRRAIADVVLPCLRTLGRAAA